LRLRVRVRAPTRVISRSFAAFGLKNDAVARAKEAEECEVGVDGVVLPHTNADFDALASAVGLARMRDHVSGCPGKTIVVLPQGANPTVQHFLALHKHLYPIKSSRLVEVDKLNWLGCVDAQRRDRFGHCAEWLDSARSVSVYDHHVDQTSDIVGAERVMGEVGAVTTLVVELLQQAQVPMDDKLATLLALGIHSDTGSLVFECTTPRDAAALHHCLLSGASQKAIMQFSRNAMSLEQRSVLNTALQQMHQREFERTSVVWSHVECEEYMPGMATVTRELMELANADVVFLAVSYRAKKKKKDAYQHVSLIGRANADLDCVNLSTILKGLNGGGHPKAAATSFRMDRLDRFPDEEFKAVDSVEQLCEALVERLCNTQIPPVKQASDVMTPVSELVACRPTTTVSECLELLTRYGFHMLPVLNDDGVLLGIVSSSNLEMGMMHEDGELADRPVKSCMETHLYLAQPSTSLPDVEQDFIQKSVGCIPVVECEEWNVDAGGEGLELGKRYSLNSLTPRMIGLITRTDVLREHAFYSNVSRNMGSKFSSTEALSFTFSEVE